MKWQVNACLLGNWLGTSSIIPIVHSETNEKKTSKVYEYCSKNVCAIHYPKGLSAARSPKDFLRRHKK